MEGQLKVLIGKWCKSTCWITTAPDLPLFLHGLVNDCNAGSSYGMHRLRQKTLQIRVLSWADRCHLLAAHAHVAALLSLCCSPEQEEWAAGCEWAQRPADHY
jgi:hypothetical protein